MKKIKKIALWFLGLVIAFFLTASALLYFQGDKLLAVVTAELNRYLLAPVEIGEASVSLSRFPAAAIKFEKVYSPGVKAGQQDTLLAAQTLYLEFGLYQLLAGEVVIDEITARQGKLYLNEHQPGQWNYKIWKQGDTSSSDLLKLKNISLRNFKIRVNSSAGAWRASADASNISIARSDAAKQSIYRIDQKLLLRSFHSEEFKLAQALPLQGKLDLATSPEGLTLRSENLKAGALVFGLNYRQQSEAKTLNLSLAGTSLRKLRELAQKQNLVKKLPELEGIISGELLWESGPGSDHYKLSFNSPGFSLRDSLLVLEDYRIDGHYRQDAGGSEILEITEIAALDAEIEVQGRATLKNFDRPQLSFSLNADQPLGKWLALRDLDLVKKAQGSAHLQLDFENRYASLDDLEENFLKNARLNGSLDLAGISFASDRFRLPVEKLNGSLNIHNQVASIERFFLRYGQSDLYLKGSFERVFDYLLGRANLGVKAAVKSQAIDLSDFLSDKKNGAAPLEFTRRVDLNLRLELAEVQYQSFRGRALSGQLNINKGIINVKELRLKADGGDYVSSFSLKPAASAYYQAEVDLAATAVRLPSVFKSFADFNQQTITGANLEGQAFLKAELSFLLDSNLMPVVPSLAAFADIRINNGHLINYKPLESLSRFAELDALKDVAFAELTNRIEIKDEVLYIPMMMIENNVLELRLTGEHHFDNAIDYHLDLKLSDVLFKKRGEKTHQQSEFSEHLSIRARNDDHLIPVRITGTTENPKVNISGADLGQAIGENLKSQKKALRKLRKPDSSESKNKEGTGLIFEWDEG